MKIIPFLLLVISISVQAQNELIVDSLSSPVQIDSKIDPGWQNWKIRSYRFGLNPEKVPVPIQLNGPLMTNATIMVRGQNSVAKRWGLHCFEAYANDDMSRITMLLNKHVEEGRKVAEMYYYGTVYNHSEPAYNWFKIGSDVRQHSFMFGRDRAYFYGSLRLSNALTLGNIGREDLQATKPEGDDETNYEQDARHVNYIALREGGDGTMFYDKDNHIVVIKVDGQWMKLVVEKLPRGVEYDF